MPPPGKANRIISLSFCVRCVPPPSPFHYTPPHHTTPHHTTPHHTTPHHTTPHTHHVLFLSSRARASALPAIAQGVTRACHANSTVLSDRISLHTLRDCARGHVQVLWRQHHDVQRAQHAATLFSSGQARLWRGATESFQGRRSAAVRPCAAGAAGRPRQRGSDQAPRSEREARAR
jgi:hypothetical protein